MILALNKGVRPFLKTVKPAERLTGCGRWQKRII